MEVKKTHRSNLENKRFIFREIGLIVALAAVFFAFETKFYQEETQEIVLVNGIDIEDDVLPIVVPQQASRPLPKIKMMPIDIIDIVEDVPELDEPDIIDVTEEQMGSVNGTSENYTNYTGNGEGEVDEDIPFVRVEFMPAFNGDLSKWLTRNLKYPARAAEVGVQGKVYIEFIVERDGSITDAKVIRSVHPDLDREALRVVNAMPKWKPGMQRDKAVRVKFTIPIAFRLN